jgi:hypothetical protein
VAVIALHVNSVIPNFPGDDAIKAIEYPMIPAIDPEMHIARNPFDTTKESSYLPALTEMLCCNPNPLKVVIVVATAIATMTFPIADTSR